MTVVLTFLRLKEIYARLSKANIFFGREGRGRFGLKL